MHVDVHKFNKKANQGQMHKHKALQLSKTSQSGHMPIPHKSLSEININTTTVSAKTSLTAR